MIIKTEEFNKMWEGIEKEKKKREADYPTVKSCLNELCRIEDRLKEFGFSDAVYCPKDGTIFNAIEFGSTGIHDCIYKGEWPKGSWWILESHDISPSRPIMYRKKGN
ncbi:MAG: hypothetical protein AAF228_13705 [Pseudomonadota bacterium]